MGDVKHVQSELGKYEYVQLKKTADKMGLTLKEALREAVLSWVRGESGFDQEDPFFKTRAMFTAKKDLASSHDESYEE